MRKVLHLLFLFIFAAAQAQTGQSPEQIRQQMARIRQSTDWNDPAAAKKANEEISSLAKQLTGGQPAFGPGSGQPSAGSQSKQSSPGVKIGPATKENVVAIASRFFNRSYKLLDANEKSRFDLDLKAATSDSFNLEAVRRLASIGGIEISIGDDHNLACVYLTAAVKNMPGDTLSINNFGAYLRIIDSTVTSVPVLLYANMLYGESPVILTQLGCSYYELGDMKQAENFFREALNYDPGFSQAHSALCELYIKQGKLREALLELFAGVKGMGGSYNRASANFAYLQQQAEEGGDKGGTTAKEAFWGETRNQMNPPDALAPLVPTIERIKMPGFPGCNMISDWIDGGGYASAAQAYSRFNSLLRKFSEEFNKAHNDIPDLPPNAVLRDYPNERFALDCITEYFFMESKKEYDDFSLVVQDIMEEVNSESEAYFQTREQYTNEFVRCGEGCAAEPYCIQECHRVYCTKECPAANIFNSKLQTHWENYLGAFRETADNQKKILDDLYEFTSQWFSRIESPYWSKIYAFEIQRVALTIIGNTYTSYAMPFPGPVHNDCGTDCSAYANPYPIPAEEVEEKEPKGNECPEDKKLNIGLAMCSISFDCESVEFGCSAVVATSIKRNFKNKSTTSFFGVGGEANLGFAKGEATAGFTMTRYDNGDLDVGVKGELTGTTGAGPVSAGKNYEVNVTVMEGLKTEAKDVIGIGF